MTKYKRLFAVHIATTSVVVACACIMNWLVWTYTPDTRFQTIETMLYPVFRVLVTLWTTIVTLNVAFHRLTLRVLMRLAHEASC